MLKALGLLVISIIIGWMPGCALAQSDDEMKQKLVNGSPWNVIWEAVGRTEKGDATLEFKMIDGKFVGETLNINGSPEGQRARGPLKFLAVKNGKVSFVNQAGGEWGLAFTPDGKQLEGTGTTRLRNPLKLNTAR